MLKIYASIFRPSSLKKIAYIADVGRRKLV